MIKDLEKTNTKTELVRPISKKDERKYSTMEVSILNGMSKIYERCIHNSLSFYGEATL